MSQNWYFYININGIVSINNIILFNEEGIFLKNSLELEKIKNITENYFGTIYLIKKNFFKELGIDIFQQDSRKFRVQTKEIFGFFKWRKFEEKLCDIQVFFSIFSILKLIIDSKNQENGVGLPIGNQTSQWFGLYYLEEID